jgi:hypothetical protein
MEQQNETVLRKTGLVDDIICGRIPWNGKLYKNSVYTNNRENQLASDSVRLLKMYIENGSDHPDLIKKILEGEIQFDPYKLDGFYSNMFRYREICFFLSRDSIEKLTRPSEDESNEKAQKAFDMFRMKFFYNIEKFRMDIERFFVLEKGFYPKSVSIQRWTVDDILNHLKKFGIYFRSAFLKYRFFSDFQDMPFPADFPEDDKNIILKILEEKYFWNGKYYSGNRIFVNDREIVLNDEQKQILDYFLRKSSISMDLDDPDNINKSIINGIIRNLIPWNERFYGSGYDIYIEKKKYVLEKEEFERLSGYRMLYKKEINDFIRKFMGMVLDGISYLRASSKAELSIFANDFLDNPVVLKKIRRLHLEIDTKIDFFEVRAKRILEKMIMT